MNELTDLGREKDQGRQAREAWEAWEAWECPTAFCI